MAKRKHSQGGSQSGMIRENMSKHANLPTEVMIRDYPSQTFADFPHLNDTMEGIDARARADKAGMKKNMGTNIKW